jgi:hypothetical protein
MLWLEPSFLSREISEVPLLEVDAGPPSLGLSFFAESRGSFLPFLPGDVSPRATPIINFFLSPSPTERARDNLPTWLAMSRLSQKPDAHYEVCKRNRPRYEWEGIRRGLGLARPRNSNLNLGFFCVAQRRVWAVSRHVGSATRLFAFWNDLSLMVTSPCAGVFHMQQTLVPLPVSEGRHQTFPRPHAPKTSRQSRHLFTKTRPTRLYSFCWGYLHGIP